MFTILGQMVFTSCSSQNWGTKGKTESARPLSLQGAKVVELVELIENSTTNIFFITSPIQIDRDLGWPTYTYYTILADKDLANFCERADAQDYAEDLMVLLEVEEYDWVVNLMLYSIFGKNAMTVAPYKPNKIELWREERKPLDLIYWNEMQDSLSLHRQH